MFFAGTVFFLSCTGLAGLFALKHWEEKNTRTYFPKLRLSADREALRLKTLLLAGTKDLQKLPPILILIATGIVRILAIGFGHLAHWVGERSHALADLVSYKHRFERKETQSEFLKQVIEHPITNRNGNHIELTPAAVSPVPPPTPERPVPEEIVTSSLTADKPKRSRLTRFGLKSRRKKNRSSEDVSIEPPPLNLER